MSLIGDIISFVRQTELSDIPEKAVTVAKTAITDVTGCMLGGMQTENSKYMYNYLRLRPQSEEWTIPGHEEKTCLADGALACGFFSHALDFDNASNFSGHSSAVIMAALLPTADFYGKSGAEVLRAYLLAQEVGFKLAMQLVPEINFRGWHITPVFGTISAVIASALMMDLSDAELAQALSLATSKAGGMMVQFGTMAKFLHCGIAASAGIECCLMAKAGLSGNLLAYEGKNGFYQALAGKTYIPEELRLGKPWALTDNSLLIKLFPCCSAMHSAVNGARQLQNEHGFTAAEIKQIVVEVPKYTISNLVYKIPQKPHEGRFSMHYGVANILLFGKLEMQSFTEERLHDRQLGELMEKIEMVVSGRFPDFVEAEPAFVTITLECGKTYEIQVDYARGRTLENPCSLGELYDKFRSCVGDLMDDARCSAVFNRLSNLEQADNLKNLI